MSAESDQWKAIAAFAIECPGALPESNIQPVQIVVTVMKDTYREVSCPFLDTQEKTYGKCLNNRFEEKPDCKHLDVVYQRNFIESRNRDMTV